MTKKTVISAELELLSIDLFQLSKMNTMKRALLSRCRVIQGSFDFLTIPPAKLFVKKMRNVAETLQHIKKNLVINSR